MRMATLLPCGILLAVTASLSAQKPKEHLILKGNTEPGGSGYQFKSIVFSHDGKTIATFGGAGVLLWDAKSGAVKQKLKPAWPVYSMAFSADDKLIALAVGALYHGDIEVWKVTGERVWQQRDVMDVHEFPLVFAADGKTVISPESSTWASAQRHAKEREPLAHSSALTLWDADTGKRIRTIGAAERGGLGGLIALSVDGKQVLTAARLHPGCRIELWDLPAGKRIGKVNIDKGGVIALSVAPDNTGAVAFYDRVEFWDVAEGKLLRTLKTGAVYMAARRPLAFSADGKLLACAQANEIALWDTQTGDRKGRLPLAKTFCLALSPDGKTLATNNQDGRVRLWDVAKVTDPK